MCSLASIQLLLSKYKIVAIPQVEGVAPMHGSPAVISNSHNGTISYRSITYPTTWRWCLVPYCYQSLTVNISYSTR